METIKSGNAMFKILIGAIFFIWGFAIVSEVSLIGIVLISIGALAFTYNSGVEIDIEKKRIRNYWSLILLKKGEWHKLSRYNCLLVKSSNKGVRTYGGRTSASIDTFEKFFEVWLIDSQKRAIKMRLLLTPMKTVAVKFAEYWSDKLNFPVKTMNDFINARNSLIR